MDHSKEYLALVDDAKSRITECTIDDVVERQQRGDKFRLIDCREDDEWRAGHARGAEHMGRGVIERDIINKVPDKNEELIIYCGGGFRSAMAADNLQRMGYARVFSLAGGWREWTKRGQPIER
jgi:rhodanese-related sulfurtransferase